MATPEYKEIFTRNLNLFLETCNKFAAQVVNANWNDWASSLFLIALSALAVVGIMSTKSCSDSYYEKEALRMSMCEAAGYIYVDHSKTTVTCLDGSGDVIQIKTDVVKEYTTRKVSVSKVPVNQQQ